MDAVQRYDQSYSLASALMYGHGGTHREAFLLYFLDILPGNSGPEMEIFNKRFDGRKREGILAEAASFLNTVK
jgi:hypothetical protein